MLLFVYGSLRKSMVNDINRTFLDSNPKFIGHATTNGSLFRANRTWFPFAKFSPDDPNEVVGEVYQLSDSAITELDYIEGSPVLFARTTIDVKFKDGSVTEVTAYSYQQSTEGLIPIESGDWKLYRGQGNE